MAKSWTNLGFNVKGNEILASKKIVGIRTIVTEMFDGEKVPDCNQEILVPSYTSEVYESVDMWYGSMLHLHIYRFEDGRVFESYIQAEPWDSGPNTYLALRDHVTKEPVSDTLWDQSVIDCD